MSTELSLAIISISLLVLVIFAIIAIIYSIICLKKIQQTTHNLELKINPLIEKTHQIMLTTHQVTDQIKNNVELTTPLFYSVAKVASLMQGFLSNFKSEMKVQQMIEEHEFRKGKVEIADWAEWIASGIILVQKLRK